ncbi:MAG: toll/interleukin-1 receptor domain-containing protein [Pseudomonadota bacterium]
MTSTVFLSYRRSDANWAASAIHSELCRHLGDDQVFMDVSSLNPGLPWKPALTEALDKCEAALVLIGGRWLEGGANARLHDEEDEVRREISVSLERGIPVVPVTLDKTPLPKLSEMPEAISELVERQAISVSHDKYKTEIAALVERLGLRGTGSASPESTTPGIRASEGLREGLQRFLKRYQQWSFSTARIAKWGAQQTGFEYLSRYSRVEIRDELNAMVAEGVAATRASKTGGTLYRLL